MADVSSDMVGDGPARTPALEMGYSGARPFPHANLSAVAAAPGCAHCSRPRRGEALHKGRWRPPVTQSASPKPRKLPPPPLLPGPASHCGAAARPGRPAHCARRPLRLRSAPRPPPAPVAPAAALAPCRSGGGTECRWLRPGRPGWPRALRFPDSGVVEGPMPQPASSLRFPIALKNQMLAK